MYLVFILGLCFFSAVAAAPTFTDTDKAVYDDMFVLKGDILELKPGAHKTRNLIVGKNKLWRDAIVPFYISPELEVHRYKIYRAMNHISNKTCIRFRPRTAEDREYISLYDGGNCFSYVGRLGKPVPVSLGRNCERLISAAHEIIHSLGAYHTQSRSDRDYYIYVHYENMQYGISENFKKLSPEQNKLFTPFDFDSIMLYGPYMGSANGRPVITPLDPNQKYVDTYEKDGLSKYDIEALNKLYRCERYGPQYAYD